MITSFGKRHEMACHHNLETYLHAYLDGGGISADPKGPLFRTIGRTTGQLTTTPRGGADFDLTYSRISLIRMRRYADTPPPSRLQAQGSIETRGASGY
jgi:cytochrome c556